jgi:large subunit ribosomal protein L31
MKKDIHPASYRTVVFKDISTDDAVLGKYYINSKETITWEDGKDYPLVKMEISAYSHPFFTGKMKFVDTAGRIDKFNKKFAKILQVIPLTSLALMPHESGLFTRKVRDLCSG